MASNLAKLLRQRSAYTGERLNAAQRDLAPQHRRAQPIPAADNPDQARFEHWILDACACPHVITMNPCGFSAVRPAPDHLTLTVESDPRFVQDLAGRILPAGDTELCGIPGLRYRRTAVGAVALYLAGTAASVTLRGVSWADWVEAADARLARLTQDGDPTLWTGPQGALTSQEREYLRGFRFLQDAEHPTWLPSGILRRIAVFQAGGGPRSCLGWKGGRYDEQHWVFQLLYRPGQSLPHDRITALLTDPVFGLPLAAARTECRCPHGDERKQCWVDLRSTRDTISSVQLRFSYRP
ncbi:hypothetical protein [Kitasatospora sp. GP82]|uniref:hypothetical protein n=1 Tax=Kitasatospora sp. GP82 TaxID=3035089 RepID=UPI00247463AE|nr:hypothetical protein [Kitasatospora sp. GP82]MDH6128802.1 hypothetical protein [Kitasatospora sp. GP82]